jgi:mannose-6-phosphate isomerase-like protein (cupin superfamily)
MVLYSTHRRLVAVGSHRHCLRSSQEENMRFITAVALFLFTSAAAAQEKSEHPIPGPRDALFVNSSEFQRDTSPTGEDVQTHVLWTDPTTGAYGAYRWRKSGTFVGLHDHSQDGRVIILKGTLVLSFPGKNAYELSAGDFTLIPANLPHTSGCKAGSDCFYYEEQAGPEDINMLTDK